MVDTTELESLRNFILEAPYMDSDNLRSSVNLCVLQGEQIEKFSYGIFLGVNLNFANNIFDQRKAVKYSLFLLS